MPNEAQIEMWSGDSGAHWVAEEARYDRMLRPYLDAVVAAADVRPGERVIDVGCGNGALTLAVAEQAGPAGEVTGVDISAPMLERGRLRAADAGLHTTRFIEADAQVHLFEPGRYDALVSRFGVMFFEDPTAAFRNLSVALRPGGRLVFACWRDALSNEWITVNAGALLQHVPAPTVDTPPDAPGPFAFADDGRVRALLTDAGFTDVVLEPVDARAPYGETVEDTIRFIQHSQWARAFVEGVDDETRLAAWTSVAEALAPYEQADGVVLGGAAWIVTATRP